MTLLTEEEAKKRWCPYAKLAVQWAGGGNRANALGEADADDRLAFEASNRCIASECMAWRWRTRAETNLYGQPVGEDAGYCGLAGEPK